MRSKTPVAASTAEVTLPSVLLRYAGIAIAALLVGAMLWPLWRSAGGGATETGIMPVCAHWDDLARESLARRVQAGKRDADLRQVGDAIFRLRRARRNCHAGWTTLACQDYLAVLSTGLSRPPGPPGCAMVKVEAADAAH